MNLHVGGEGTISKEFKVRAGVLYDPTPSPEDTLAPDLPDATRLNLAVGGSYFHRSGVHFDLGFQYLVMFKHTSTLAAFPGDYGGNPIILGLSLGYTMPAEKKEGAGAPSEEMAPPPPPPDTTTPPPPPPGEPATPPPGQ